MARPRPEITPIDRPFWDWLSRGEYRLQRCAACATFRFPAAPVCPDCGDAAHAWDRVSGRGEVISWVVFHRSYFPALAAEIPYNVAMIRLAEGPVVIANLRGIDNADIRMGLPVAVALEPLDDLTIANFRPVEGA
jgi:uncharacterized protein